jgi:hypothetical protein
MGKNDISEKDIMKYRAFAAAFSACGNRLEGYGKPIYWDERAKAIDTYGLKEVLQLSPEKILEYHKRKLPTEFMNDAEAYLKDAFGEDFSIENLNPEEVLELVSDQKFFLKAAIPYIHDCSMKNGIRDVYECMPIELIDRYVIQVIEQNMDNSRDYRGQSYKAVSIETTDSTYFTEIHLLDIPVKEKDGKIKPAGNARSKMRLSLSKRDKLSGDKLIFTRNIMGVVVGNRETLSDAIANQQLQKFRSDTDYAANILCVDI